MITDVVPASPSAFLRATCVVRLVITSVQPGPWKPVGEGLSRREVDLGVRLEEVFKAQMPKGEVAAGRTLTVRLEQNRSGAPIYSPVPGLWSEQSLDKGRELVIACAGASLQAALSEPLLILPKTAAAEARLIAQAEEQHLDALAVSRRAKELAKTAPESLDFAFAQWLWARHGARALVEQQAAEAVFSLLELPGLPGSARVTLLVDAVGAASAAPGTTLVGSRRLVRALFKLLALPDAQPVAENAVSVDLPLLLRLHDPPLVPRSLLLSDAERDEARKLLEAWQGKADKSALRAWLGQP